MGPHTRSLVRLAAVKALTRAAHQMVQRVELLLAQRQRDAVERHVQTSVGTAVHRPLPVPGR